MPTSASGRFSKTLADPPVGTTYRVVWTLSAVEDLEEILPYLVAEGGTDVTRTTYEGIRAAIGSLTALPHRCRRIPELRQIPSLEYRELIFRSYRLMFRIDQETVVLLGVLDARRDLEEMLIRRATLWNDRDQ